MVVYFTPADTTRIAVYTTGSEGLYPRPKEKISWQDTRFEIQKDAGLLRLRVADNSQLAALFDERGNRASPLIHVGDPKKITSVESKDAHPRLGEEIVITAEKGAITLFGIGDVELNEKAAPLTINGKGCAGVFDELRGAAILCSEKGMQCVPLQSNAYGLVEVGKIFMEMGKYSQAERALSEAQKKSDFYSPAAIAARANIRLVIRFQDLYGDVVQIPPRVAKIEQR